MSTTAPMHWTMVPDALASVMTFSDQIKCFPCHPERSEGSAFRKADSSSPAAPQNDKCSYRRRASDDLGDLFRDPRLAVLVVDERELVDQGLGVVRSGFHRDHARALLRGHVVAHRLEDDRLDVAREHLVEHDFRVGLVEVVPGPRGSAEALPRKRRSEE